MTAALRSISRRASGRGASIPRGRFGVPQGLLRRGRARRSIEDGRVIADIGGRENGKDAGIVAFDASTGAVQWTATNHQASYSSAVGATFGGKRTALFFTRQGLVGLDPVERRGVCFNASGARDRAASVNAASPIVAGDRIFISRVVPNGRGADEGPGKRARRDLVVGRGDVQSLRDERRPQRRPVRFSRTSGVQSELSRRGSRQRQGAVERRPLSRRAP